MSEKTGIQWTDKTWNPWQGCHKVSQGCKHCYMFRDKARFGQDPNEVKRSAPATFGAPLRWREPARVFTCSWSDWFIAEADAWRAEAWDVVRRTPHLTYQILTKRADRVAACLPEGWGEGWPNVWLGVSVEDQAAADARIPHLLRVPAAVRFVSCEPLLGPVDLGRVGKTLRGDDIDCRLGTVTRYQYKARNDSECSIGVSCQVYPPEESKVDWVIVGGESGPGARPCDLAWVRSLARQCRAAGVACFVKQDSGIRPGIQGRIPDDIWNIKEFPGGN